MSKDPLRGPAESAGTTEGDHDFPVDKQIEARHPRCVSAVRRSASERHRQDATRPQIGEIVEVRPIEEILATLDSEGALEGVPFMPEMLAFCGKRFPVFKRADYTCTNGEPRYLENTLHLDNLRCDGSAHRSCQAKCLIFWKEAWIKRIAPEDPASKIETQGLETATISVAAFLGAKTERNDGTMYCQATEIRRATCAFNLSLSQYTGNVYRDFRAQRIGWRDLRRLLTWIRERILWSAFIHWARLPWNRRRYEKTPAQALNLRPGDLVKVRSIRDILSTLDRRGRNRGLRFTPEMFRYCGHEHRVLARLERRIDENGGHLVEFGNPSILLENVVCTGQRTFCSRTEYHYWREIWVERRPTGHQY